MESGRSMHAVKASQAIAFGGMKAFAHYCNQLAKLRQLRII